MTFIVRIVYGTYICVVCGQNADVLNIKHVVHVVTSVFYSYNKAYYLHYVAGAVSELKILHFSCQY
jgi:hypothetical protein